MPYSIPSFTKILMYSGNSTIFVYFSWHPLCLWICYGARNVHFTLYPRRKGTLFFLHIQLHNHQNDLNPCLWLYYYGKVIGGLEKNINNKKRQTVHGTCNLTKLHFKILIYLLLISNNAWAIFSLRDHQQITFVTLNRFCPLSKPPPFPPPQTPVPNGQNQNGWNPKQN